MNLGQKQNKFTKTMSGAILAILLIVFLFPQNALADTLQDKRNELNAIQQQINQQKSILDQKTKEKNTLANQLAIMDSQILQTILSIQATQKEIDIASAEIEKLKQEIIQKEQELAYQKEVLNESIRVIYQETDVSFIETIFSSNNISQVIDRTEYLGAIEGKITSTIAEINQIKNALAQNQKDQEKKKLDQEVLLAQQQATQNSLNTQRASQAQLVASTRGQEAAYQAQLAKIQQLYNSTNSELKQMEQAAGGGGGAPSMSGFYWPTVRNVRLPFGVCGCEAYFCGLCHSGIDISTGGASLPVVASKDGTVVAVVDGRPNTYPWSVEYGNVVKIDHGNGFLTVYAHLENGMIRVRPGDRVSGGSTIVGFVDNSGFSTGPHLHFEVRYNNRPVDPLSYLP